MGLTLFASPTLTWAQAPAPEVKPPDQATGLFDESTPYLDYADFNGSDEEDLDSQYFQYGRFFGFSIGGGYQMANGNRSKIYDPALPRLDLKVHYWFDFQVAMNLGIFFATHNVKDSSTTTRTSRLNGYQVDVKYYFDTRNASAPIAFSNPFILMGVGAISKTVFTGTTNPDTESTFTYGFGAGLEFPLSYKRTYFTLEGRYNSSSFLETYNGTSYNGGFISLIGSILFVW